MQNVRISWYFRLVKNAGLNKIPSGPSRIGRHIILFLFSLALFPAARRGSAADCTRTLTHGCPNSWWTVIVPAWVYMRWGRDAGTGGDGPFVPSLCVLSITDNTFTSSPGAPSRLRDGERLVARGPGSVNGDGAAVHHIAIPDADVRRSAAGVVVLGEGDAAGICCCGISNDTAGVGIGLSVAAHGSGIRVVADCEVDVAVAVLISHVPGNAADVTLISTSRSGDGALVGATRDGAVVCYIRDNAAQLADSIISVKADGAADDDILHGSKSDIRKQSAMPRGSALQVAHGVTLSVEGSIESPPGTDGRPFVVVEVDVGSELECVVFK